MQLSWMAVLALIAPSEGIGEQAGGEQLLRKLACTSCHTAPGNQSERLAPLPAPNLDNVGGRMTPRSLRQYLLRPHGERPGSAMPDLLAGMGQGDREDAAEALTHWLVSQGGPLAAEPQTVSPTRVENGRQLFHSIGCVACHAPIEPAEDLEFGFWDFVGEADESEFATSEGEEPALAIPMPGLAKRTTPQALAQFLQQPHKVRPAGRMPSLSLGEGEALDIAYYLLRDQAWDGSEGIQLVPGLAYQFFEGSFSSAARDSDAFDGSPVREGVVDQLDELPEHPETNYAFRFEGFLAIPKTGNYRFETESDDGSMVYVDGKKIVDNDGHHGPKRSSGEVWLEEGLRGIELTFFQGGGGATYEVRWSGPDFESSPLPAEGLSHSSLIYNLRTRPFEVDDKLAANGRVLFETLGCVACHEAGAYQAPAFSADLDPSKGCLSSGLRAVHYDIDDAQRALLASAIEASATWAPLTPAERVTRNMELFACSACHSRDDLGGVHSTRQDYFHSKEELDLGQEGRMPPHLDGVGAKLRDDWLLAVLTNPKARVRPYLATRMPHFVTEEVEALGRNLLEVDAREGMDDEPPYSEEAVEDGRRLVGTDGLGCIQCHTFNGYDSLGIPAVDLAHVHERIRPGWFETLLTDPQAVGMNSRMPVFWDAQGLSPVKDVLGGKPHAQAKAVRTYLSLGSSMPLPKGLVAEDARYELQPEGEPILTSVFLKDIGPRVMLVGTPQHVHYAFDVENSTLTHAWRGRFFNAKGTWHGRAGKLEKIPEDMSVTLPVDAPFAVLEEPGASWPRKRGREGGVKPLGRRITDTGLPSFRYQWRSVEVFDECAVAEEGWLIRNLLFEGTLPDEPAYFLVARGDEVQAKGENTWSVDGLTLKYKQHSSGTKIIERPTARGTELLLEFVPFTNADPSPVAAFVSLTYQWR